MDSCATPAWIKSHRSGARCCAQTRKAPSLETDVTWSAGWKWTSQLACHMEPGTCNHKQAIINRLDEADISCTYIWSRDMLTSSFPFLGDYSLKTFQQWPADANMSIMLEQHIGKQIHLIKRNKREGNAWFLSKSLKVVHISSVWVNLWRVEWLRGLGDK